METLVSMIRMRLGRQEFRHASALAGHGERDHLEWMVNRVAEDGDFPLDKKLRWLGFAAGALDVADGGPESASPERLGLFACPVLFSPYPRHSHEILLYSANDEAMEGLEPAVEGAGGRLIDLMDACRGSMTARMVSFCLGYLQAYAAAHGVLSVDEERVRTRPIYHAAYRACGYVVPARAERAA